MADRSDSIRLRGRLDGKCHEQQGRVPDTNITLVRRDPMGGPPGCMGFDFEKPCPDSFYVWRELGLVEPI